MEYVLEVGGSKARVRSLKSQTDEGTDAARTLAYFQELARQATIYNVCHERARRRALEPATSQDDALVWADLQGSLFAAIVVQRLLQPVLAQVRKQGYRTQAEARRFADERGQRLRNLLAVPDGAPFLAVSSLRNSFEHIDERLDALMRPSVASVADWYISDGLIMETASEAEVSGYALRVYMPARGILYFDQQTLNLYALDIGMLDLRRAIEQVGPEVRAAVGPYAMIGSHRLVRFDKDTAERTREWLVLRKQSGHPVGE